MSAKRLTQASDNGINSFGPVPDKDATERQLANVFTCCIPPMQCVNETWYLWENGCWKKKDKHQYKKIALEIQHEQVRKVRMATSIISHVEYENQIDPALLKSFHLMHDDGSVSLNCQNGVVHVSPSEISIQEHSPFDNFTGQIAAEYIPDAKCPFFNGVMIDALPERDDVLLFESFVGSILLPDSKFEASLCCYGPTGTSKSTLATGIKSALRTDIITNLTLQQICDPKCFHLHKLHCSAVNIATELNALAVSSENFKRLVSGEPVDADRKYLDSVNMETTAKFWFLTNELPKFVDGTDAELRRLRFLRFGHRDWIPDPSLKARIQEERNGVFLFMVYGLQKLLSMSEIPFGSTDSIRTRDRFKVQNDPIGVFVQTCCSLRPDAEEFKDHLSDHYNRFCRDNGIPPLTSPEPLFRKLYERHPLKTVRRRDGEERVQKVQGIRLNE